MNKTIIQRFTASVTVISIAITSVLAPVSMAKAEQSPVESPLQNVVEELVIEEQVQEELMAEEGLNNQELSEKDEAEKEIQTLPKESLKKDLSDYNQDEKQPYVPGEVLVKFRPDYINLELKKEQKKTVDFAKANDLVKKADIAQSNIAVLRTKKGESVKQLVEKLTQDPAVEYVEPNYIYKTNQVIPNDKEFDKLWGLHNTGQAILGVNGTADADIDAPEAWDIYTGNKDIIVAVVDTGISYDHPDLKTNMWDGNDCVDQWGGRLGGCIHGYDFANDDNDPMDDNGHGTHVAGTIGATGNDGIGVVGVNHDVKIMAVKSGTAEGWLLYEDVINGINFARMNGAKVINASFGGGGTSQGMYEAIRKFGEAGGIFVASAGNAYGNDNDGLYPSYPCSYDLDNIICVAATDNNDQLADFSSIGANTVDVGAPGVNILSTLISNVRKDEIILQDLEGITPPQLPNDFIKTGNWGVRDYQSNKYLSPDAKNIPYEKNTISYITSPQYSLSNIDYARFKFYALCDTEYDEHAWKDYLILEYSPNGGNNWYHITQIDEMIIDLLNGSDLDPAGFADRTFDFQIPSEYYTNNFMYRYTWIADDNDDTGDLGLGCMVDDIQITKSTSALENTYDYYSGTSMAAPHVAGLVALVVGYNMELPINQIKEIILETGDTIPALSGKTLTSKRINAHNALKVFDPEVGQIQAAQKTNGSGDVDITFKAKDGFEDLKVKLAEFQYSLDGGNSWKTPDNGDNTNSLSENWNDNFYYAKTDFSGNVYSFTWNAKFIAEKNNVKVRFKAYDGAKYSDFVESQSFKVDNKNTRIYINAPTKAFNNTIKDTTIKVVDKDGINKDKVTIDRTTTVTPENLQCTQTNEKQVDCTIEINTSGNLVVNAQSDTGTSYQGAELNYVIENAKPQITITAPTKVKIGVIRDTVVTVTDNYGIKAENVIASSETTATKSYWCEQKSPLQVDCYVTIVNDGDLVMQATDNAGNVTTVTEPGYVINDLEYNGYASAVITAKGSFTINNSAETTDSRAVNLQIKSAGGSYMVIGNNKDFHGTDWEKYTSTKSWVLTPELGEKTVYMRLKSITGELSPIYTQKITLVEAPPVITVDLKASSMSFDKQFAQSNKEDKMVITVNILGTDGKPMVGKEVTLKTNRENDTFKALSEKTNNKGQVSFEVSSDKLGMCSVTAIVDDKELLNKLLLQFIGQSEQGVDYIGLNYGDLIKSIDSSIVYYFGKDQKKHKFTTEQIFYSYYDDFSQVKELPKSQLDSIETGNDVKIKPGTVLLKLPNKPTLYTVAPGNTLHAIANEKVAKTLLGHDWNHNIKVISKSVFDTYNVGMPITGKHLSDGYVFKYEGDNPDIYYVQDNKKRKIVNMDIFRANKLRKKFMEIISVHIPYESGEDLKSVEDEIMKVYF